MALLPVYTPAHTLYAFHEANVESAMQKVSTMNTRRRCERNINATIRTIFIIIII